MELLEFYFNKCRFCYSEVDEEDSTIIDEIISNQFECISSTNFMISPKLSSLICRECNEKITTLYYFRQDLKDKQEKLCNLLAAEEEEEASKEIIIEFDPNSIIYEDVDDIQETNQNEEYSVIEEQLDEIVFKEDELKSQSSSRRRKQKFPTEKSSHYQCSECSKIFSDRAKLKIHSNRVHNHVRKCKYCDFSANSRSEFLKHIKLNHFQEHENLDVDLRICPDCGKILKGNNHLNFHIKTKHLKLTKYSCDLCSFRSYGKYEIRSHLLITHLPIELRKKFPCDLCSSVLTTAMSLKTHKTHKHSNLKPHTCFCGKSYALRETLKSHIRNVHNGERKYKCLQCGKGFNSNSRLKDHVNNNHGEKQEIPCEICGKVFNSLRNLNTHKIYHEEPKLKCEFCEKLFFIKKNLREHQESVHLQVTYKCEQCQRILRSLSGLRRHVKSHCKGN